MDRHPFPFQGRGRLGGGGFVERVGHHDGGPSDLAWVIFALLLVLFLLAIVSLALDAYYRSQGNPRPFFKWIPPGGGPPGMFRGGRALAVLDLRYARGEMSRKDYLQARDDLGTPAEPEDEITEVAVPPPRERGRKTTT